MNYTVEIDSERLGDFCDWWMSLDGERDVNDLMMMQYLRKVQNEYNRYKDQYWRKYSITLDNKEMAFEIKLRFA